ncbi:hypothetical protein BbINS_01236 [Bartonella bacilliformis INS]|uniref:Uncharacterized protein n=2 Tax=Bartonella bacilliformis TaxID=774 RepID=A1URJ2_BARBK|nr:hypothetical protein BARBAKC583_0270 [Bartonella bacilliformis KC583]EKS45894.1 hypothetical protein BbINS_01236 [Bartonella bacilliformis INS]
MKATSITEEHYANQFLTWTQKAFLFIENTKIIVKNISINHASQ